mmetsp:Transcript_27834/g.52459  ORF Transcript_27834/g.52459 Transcript_27834/m.52459 type:complete len:91 (+) Transcript_27834:2090-2362(+)
MFNDVCPPRRRLSTATEEKDDKADAARVLAAGDVRRDDDALLTEKALAEFMAAPWKRILKRAGGRESFMVDNDNADAMMANCTYIRNGDG